MSPPGFCCSASARVIGANENPEPNGEANGEAKKLTGISWTCQRHRRTR
jgi:hypothetical protein